MALISCEECGKQVSDKAANCPHCGAPVEVTQNVTCEECSADYPATSDNCPNCGAPNDSLPATGEPAPTMGARPPATPAGPLAAPPQPEPVDTDGESDKRKKRSIIATGIFILFVIGIVASKIAATNNRERESKQFLDTMSAMSSSDRDTDTGSDAMAEAMEEDADVLPPRPVAPVTSSGSQRFDRANLIGQWTCHASTDIANHEGEFIYSADGTGTSSVYSAGQDNGTPFQSRLDLSTRWRLQGSNLVETVTGVEVRFFSVNGQQIYDRAFLYDRSKSLVGQEETSRITRLSGSQLTYRDSVGYETECRKGGMTGNS
ncbi:hypothetical protein GCM10011371_12490 [Novosphingobium marinum]|uniref:Putative nucleic acid-binding Zn ribbon protein n=1 Tax=Novosphingobium marinum TaxID=1514948 RepID=A0A7Z0BUM7_9SPHN|nr:zinc ribbon domain-containing protein [Novosphingobium marinum]NYH95358.1 putative nucleic acid-binding Zn ribbon protein [Novosphingobium marinum]GGC26415.1 hypothetical protein GCM10011371_12490 [Novosphingobium marinum]